MSEAIRPVEEAASADGLPIAPSLGPALEAAQFAPHATLVDRRILYISLLSMMIAVAAAFIADVLMKLIGLVTNLAFFGHVSTVMRSPAENHLGVWVIVVPMVGGIIVGLMARYGSSGIRGHGIPEAMERILLHQSRIPKRLTFLKPLSAALAIGTGGPFGAEGPIIATGGALGSLVGQVLHTSATERKTLLAAGAAAGMAATFGSPVSACLLAIELLLFEFRPRSFIPVALACTVAAGIRFGLKLPYPVFALPALSQPGELALAIYVVIGMLCGVASIYVTRAVYFVEDLFAHFPIHWMWWPAIGAIPVGIIGFFFPRTLGVGYDNISDMLSGKFIIGAALLLGGMKFISWAIALGSGTSGGTLAPLFTIGSALGFVLGALINRAFPHCGIDLSVAALVGMAAIFAGAARAMLASVVFAFETTLQPLGLLPLLGGCAGAYLISCLFMRNTIMTEKIARHGVRVPAEYSADSLQHHGVDAVMTPKPLTLKAEQTIGEIRAWVERDSPESRHQGYPVIDSAGVLAGVLTRRDFLNSAHPANQLLSSLITRPAVLVYSDCSLRDAANHMVNHDIGRLPVIDRAEGGAVIGIITRSDLLRAGKVKSV